jgi:hypothetical protein
MMGFFNQHIGLRGEVRYLRTLEDTNGRLHYWRAAAGLTFR